MSEIKFDYIIKQGHDLIHLPYTITQIEDSTKLEALRLAGRIVARRRYTGLKDKNGFDIFEADIVRYQYPQKQLKYHQQLCKVVYEPKAAAFLLFPGYFEPQVKYLGDIAKSNRQYDTRTYELCEIIGNIYDNPELLKENTNG